MVKLQDLQGCLQIGLRLSELHLYWPQAVGVGRGQVHSQQGKINLGGRESQKVHFYLHSNLYLILA